MRHGLHGLALAVVLVAAPLWARAPQSADAHVSRTMHKHQGAAAVDHQRAKVQRLQDDVAAQEAGSRSAAQRLKQQDAEIAELQRQLQAAQQDGAAADKGH